MLFREEMKELSNESFMEQFVVYAEEFAEWQAEYERREKMNNYKNSKVFALLRKLHLIFRSAYMGEKAEYNKHSVEFLETFDSQMADDILNLLTEYVCKNDYCNVCEAIPPLEEDVSIKDIFE